MSTRTHTKTILIIDDEASIRDMISWNLNIANFAYRHAHDCQQANREIAKQRPDLILLDWMLPGISGIDYAKQLKNNPSTRDIPIIMLTARADEDNKVKGFDVGADDYMVKPFSPRELIARIKAVIRRTMGSTDTGWICSNHLALNIDSQEVYAKGTKLDLSPKEYQLLKFLMTHANKVYSRQQLLDCIWGQDVYLNDRTVDSLVRHLRKVLKNYQLEHSIETVRSCGYRFIVEKQN